MSTGAIILTVLGVVLYFIILFLVPKVKTVGNIKIFADFTDVVATFVLNIMILPFFVYALNVGVEQFIYGYSFLAGLLIVYNFRQAYQYNKGNLLGVATSLVSRITIPAINSLFFGLNFWIFLKYTAMMGLSLKLLWGFCLFSIAFFIALISLHNLASMRKFSSLIGFMKGLVSRNF